jgi:hypothetical protein
MNRKQKFWGTIEFLSGQSAAIVALTDEDGEWAGGGRIELPKAPRIAVRDWLYDLGYEYAAKAVAAKGGRLERFSVVR